MEQAVLYGRAVSFHKERPVMKILFFISFSIQISIKKITGNMGGNSWKLSDFFHCIDNNIKKNLKIQKIQK